MNRMIIGASLTAILTIAFSLPSASQGKSMAESKASQVSIDNFSFTPASLTVPVGTEVTWVNHDDVPHIVVSADKRFRPSPVLDTDDKFSTKFTAPGTYQYYCSVHPKMTGEVVVK